MTVINPVGPFSSRAEREAHIVDFVTATQRSFEEQTLPDRAKWREAEDLFAGRMNWGEDNANEEWMSRIFLPEFAPLIREVATLLQNALLERDELVNLIPANDESKQIALINEKLVRYYIKRMGFFERIYEYLIAGGIYGFATWKQTVLLKPYFRPEVVIEQLDDQLTKQLNAITTAEVKKDTLFPDSEADIQEALSRAVNRILGNAGEGQFKPPSIKKKKSLEFCFGLELVNPFNYFTMPDNKLNESAIHIERSYCKLFQLAPLFEAKYFSDAKRKDLASSSRGFSGRGTSGYAANYNSLKWRQRSQLDDRSPYFPNVELSEYYGPLLDKNGEPVDDKSYHFVIANGQHLLRDALNPSWEQQSPYFSAIFGARPFKPNGVGVGDSMANIQRVINELFSLYVDALKLDTYAPMAVNADMLLDPSQIDGGIRPREVIQLYGGDAKTAFSELPRASNNSAELFQTIQQLSLSGQKGASINTMTSNPASRARISAAEVQSNDSRRIAASSSLAKEIDQGCIEPLVERTLSLILQYGFTADNLDLLRMRGVLSDSEYELLANIPPVERFLEASKNYTLDVRGLRSAVERRDFLARLTELLQQLNQMPPDAKQRLDWSRILTDAIETYGFNANKWLRQNTPQDKALEENALLKLGQQVSILPDDDHVAHLPAHYQAVLEAGPQPSLVAHIQGHIQGAQINGLQIPPPPPEVAQALGLPPPQAQQERSLGRLEQDKGSPVPSMEQLLQ